MKSRLATLLSGALLAACASVQPISLPRESLSEFAIDARFALRFTAPGAAPKSSSGRLNWQHRVGDDQILLANPIGVGTALIASDARGARLRTADGRVFQSNDPDALVGEITGQHLPIRRIPDWLLGRTGKHGHLAQDEQGRPLRLAEAGWKIDYEYDSPEADAPPSRLTIRRGSELELRLRIEEWKSTP